MAGLSSLPSIRATRNEQQDLQNLQAALKVNPTNEDGRLLLQQFLQACRPLQQQMQPLQQQQQQQQRAFAPRIQTPMPAAVEKVVIGQLVVIGQPPATSLLSTAAAAALAPALLPAAMAQVVAGDWLAATAATAAQILWPCRHPPPPPVASAPLQTAAPPAPPPAATPAPAPAAAATPGSAVRLKQQWDLRSTGYQLMTTHYLRLTHVLSPCQRPCREGSSWCQAMLPAWSAGGAH